MAHGTVKFFNVAKGFGFITSDDDGKDVFVPAASVSAAGIAGLKAGQRLSFDAEPDKKGMKAVGLKLLDEPLRPEKKAPPREQHVREQQGREHHVRDERPRLTLYLDSSDEDAQDVLEDLREAGHEPRLVDYIAAPPPANELKRLSLLLRDGNQSLVRKYEPMFLELRLDDRFISDSEFWGAIHEHPSLINGPVLATGSMACVCRSEKALASFLDAMSSGGAQPAARPKGLSDRLLQLVRGEAVPPRPAKKTEEPPAEKPVAMKPVAETPVEAPARKVAAKEKEKPAAKPVKAKAAKPASKAPAPKVKAIAKPAPKAKAAPRPKAATKKAAAKPVKKSRK